MSITWYERAEQRSAAKDRNNKRTYRRYWKGQALTSPYSPALALANAPVAIGQAYSDPAGGSDTGAFCTDLAIVPVDDDPLEFSCTAEYGPYDPETTPQSPLDRKPEVSWRPVTYEKIVDLDRNGDPILNAAGDPFDPPVTEEDSRPILVVVRNMEFFDAGTYNDYRNAINSDIFLDLDPYTVRSHPVEGELIYDPDAPEGFYWRVSMAFEIKKEGWRRRILNQGYRVLYDSGAKKKIATNDDGSPVTTPVLLAEDGTQLPIGGDPNYIESEIRPELPFGVFDLTLADLPGLILS